MVNDEPEEELYTPVFKTVDNLNYLEKLNELFK